MARLLRSFRKEQLRANIKWQASEWQALLAGYQATV